jgi:hypothetical protein
MTERLTAGLPPDILRALSQLALSDEVVATATRESRPSLKDAPYLDVLARRPELERDITTAMAKLKLAGLELPVLHVTSRATRFPDGTEHSTGYLENIQANGFRARDTNVAALVQRGPTTHVADPEYFAENPHKLLRAVGDSLGRYAHHGVRTNKQSLGGQRDAGRGVSTLLVIDAADVPLIPGTDYDDHFMLGGEVSAGHIMGSIDLEGKKAGNPEDVAAVVQDMVGMAAQYADEHHHAPV